MGMVAWPRYIEEIILHFKLRLLCLVCRILCAGVYVCVWKDLCKRGVACVRLPEVLGRVLRLGCVKGCAVTSAEVRSFGRWLGG